MCLLQRSTSMSTGDDIHNPYVCYLLKSCSGGRPATYVGVTNNTRRRLRQHNCIIKGGAKYTSAPSRRPWAYALQVTGFTDYRNALRFEWAWKHMPPRKKHGLAQRVQKLGRLLRAERWTSASPLSSDMPTLRVLVLDDDLIEQVHAAVPAVHL